MALVMASRDLVLDYCREIGQIWATLREEGKSREREGGSVGDRKEGYGGEVGSIDDYIDHGGPQDL